MANEANNVTLNTNFNVAPYYDDFDETKNFHRVLFRPGLAVQARELTQVQSILQNQIDRFASHIFKEGSTVQGLEMNYDPVYDYVKLRNNNSTGSSVNVGSFLNKTIKGATSGVIGLVVNTAQGSEANTPNFKTFFVKYLSANTSTGYRYFANNEILNDVAGSGLSCNTITSSQGGATGFGAAAEFNSGIVYAKDHFIRVSAQTVIISKYNTQTASGRVGFDITEEIITEVTDTSLLDPAQGSYNYAAPGAARLKLSVELINVPLNQTVSNTFVQLLVVENGTVQSISNRTQYSQIRDYMAQRTYDESGDYVVSGFAPIITEHLKQANNQGKYTSAEGGNSSLLFVSVEPGKAYVKGYDIENILSSGSSIEKALDYRSIESAKALADYGNYVIIDNVAGQWDVNQQGTISLRGQQANSVSNKTYSTISFPSSHIGRARVRGVQHYSGTPGLPSAQYKLYLTDIVMNSGFSFSNTQFIGWNSSTGANGHADIIVSNGKNANTFDSRFNRAVFSLPAGPIRKLRDTSGNVNNDFSFYKSFDVTFSSTSGQATITTGDSSETFDGSGVLSDAATRTDFYVVSRAAANTGTFTETLSTTSGSNTVTASATIDGKVNPGDIINIHTGGGDFLVSAVSGTTINLFGNATASGAGKAFHKRFVSGQILDFAGVGKDGDRSITISGTPSTTALLDMNEPLTSTMAATAIVILNKIDGQEATKTINRNRLVQIHVGSNRGGSGYTANTTGPWNLGLSDGFKLISVRKKSSSDFSSTTDGTDVTSNFTLDTGMNDGYYDHAKLVKKSTSKLSIASGDRLLVSFDYFTHSNRDRGYFSFDSYPVNDQTAGSDTTKIYTYEVPLFTSQTDGSVFDLRNSIDFRPRITDTANSVTTVTNIATNPLTSLTVTSVSGGLHFSPPNEDFTTDLDYYLRRNDVIGVKKDGQIDIIRGVPDAFPVTPPTPHDVMPIAQISLAPYPSLPNEIGRRVNRPDLTNRIRRIKNKRYTMKDIGKIAERIDRLEYYSALSLTEKNAKDLLIQDENGLDRFKNGILVDSFTGHNIGNVFDLDYKISVDSKRNEMRPLFSLDNTSLNYTANSTNVVRTNVTPAGVSRDQTISISNSQVLFSNGETLTSGAFSAKLRHKSDNKLYIEAATGNFVVSASVTGSTSGHTATISAVSTITPGSLVTLPYTHDVLVQQPAATTTRNCVGTAYNYNGNLFITPDSDYWYDTTQRPDAEINIDLNTDNWLHLANSWQTQWQGWESIFTGEPSLVSETTTDVGNRFLGDRVGRFWEILQGTLTEQIFTTPTIEARTGVRDIVNVTTDTQSIGNFVRDVSIQPFMRSQQIYCKLVGMKASSRLWAFFDGIDVNAYVQPLTESEYNNRLRSQNNGGIEFCVLPTSEIGDPVYSDSEGNAYVLFRLPNDQSLRFRTGTKRLRFVDNPTNSTTFGQFTTSAETEYTAEGLTSGVSDISVSTRRPVIETIPQYEERGNSFNTQNSIPGQRLVGWWRPAGNDPIAQTFLIAGLLKAQIETSGMYLTKIDIFFSTKDSKLPITLQLQEVDQLTGALTPRVVPFSRTTLDPSEVHVSSDGSKPTTFYFPSPVYLQEGKEYGAVLIPAAANPNYNVFTSVLGELDILTGATVSEQPACGFLFTSANQRTWVPVENEDLKFTAYYAKFDTSVTGNLTVKKPEMEFLTVANNTGGFLKVGEPVTGETTLIGTFAPGSGLTGNVASSNSFVQGMVSGATGIITSITSNKVTVRGVSTTAKFKGKEAVRFRLGANATHSPITGNSTGVITSATYPIGRVYMYDTVNFANNKLYVSNSSHVNSGSLWANGRLFSVNSWVRGQIDGNQAKIVTINNLVADDINLQTNMILPSNTAVTASMKMATSTSARDSSYVRVNINNNTELGNPRYIISRANEANTSATSATMGTNKSVEFKYDIVSRNLVASPAIDLERLSFVSMHNLISSNTDIGSSEDYVSFGGESLSRYITRTVTLADGQDAEDLRIYLTGYKPSGSDIHVYYKLLHGEDSDTIRDARWIPMERDVGEGFTSLSRYSSSENRDDFIEFVYKIPQYSNIARSGANTATGIVEYRNSSRARFVSFKYFAIKVVLTNPTSSNPPRVRELRAIALQV